MRREAHTMRRQIAAIAALAALTLAGCLAPNGGGVGGQRAPWSGKCVLRPIIVSSGGSAQWTAARVRQYTRWLDAAFGPVGLKFDVRPVETVENPGWFVIDKKSDFYAMSEESMRRSAERGELVVWFVDRIPAWSAGGVAQKPSNAAGKYQHGVAISFVSSEASLLHELGHAFNLSHTWSDSLTDTPTKSSTDCATEPCNAMTYCFDQRLPKGRCLGRTFSRQQAAEAQRWAAASPRNQVVSAPNAPPGAAQRTGNTLPEID
jgi:hypothetical protein